MATYVTNSAPQGNDSTLPAMQVGPSDKYINELFTQLVAQNQTSGYGTVAASLLARDQLECYLNDLHPKHMLAQGKLDINFSRGEIALLKAELQTIDRDEVAKRGGLPEIWLIPMLARRHGMIGQPALKRVVDIAFRIEQDCVYIDGYPAKNRADLVAANPEAKIYTDEEVNLLRDLFFKAIQTNSVDPTLTALVSNQQNIRQSTVKDIAVATFKILNQK